MENKPKCIIFLDNQLKFYKYQWTYWGERFYIAAKQSL